MKNFKNFKKPSESYAKLIRDNFPIAFEKEKLNKKLFEFVSNEEKSLFVEDLLEANAIPSFISYITSIIGEEKIKKTKKSVEELLSNVGYNFYICKNKKDVEFFKKYYKKSEEICTFNSIDNRLKNYFIFWIVKKDIKNIKHLGKKRNRQDAYGTSCCSIQIAKNNAKYISIKNRYNHMVSNCDATFSNNLDNISDGLTYAINQRFDFKIDNKKNSFELNKWILIDEQLHYYNFEINGIYYGINKYIKNGKLHLLDKNKEIMVDYFIINLKTKEIKLIDNDLVDSFSDLKFNKIEIIKKKNSKDIEDESGVLKIII